MVNGNEEREHRADRCPACGSDLDAGPIPTELRRYYAPGARASRRIAVYDEDMDCTVAWKCPGCGHEWPREGIGSGLPRW